MTYREFENNTEPLMALIVASFSSQQVSITYEPYHRASYKGMTKGATKRNERDSDAYSEVILNKIAREQQWSDEYLTPKKSTQ